ncbi:MAG TPA: sulfide/dihydroorotate dehydrogenase-like FAD/NAD-binding protein [Deltaproteobacteria bacterium]|nr:MAG: ferredoxin-NADP reductase [Deltaproteobacteria bacterium GWA2_55_82]OGQ62427.1 MAG: ferredoxin-NADP reductase [Deltaproteobacteria bacterium RIFCSPLOWO2_02_FULL_55_12]OIJ73341.1 MAG: ferredoxin-NADP reductase [Deltaproteobacteria bacterium GWC2_55_46]HBG45384.1 sulfide/dihydroorotate dehydrogenase-like FAD/NAD-binding protein [Deltaproteobacteria bacterium]HCY10215.1 sulfide/dihydroorotate dehydrogenase-like FAD/NAD-binding protein [Deltaproteobacteria bacterium]
MFVIMEKKELAHTVYQFKIKAPSIARKRKAGQFVILRLNETGERFPLTILDSDTNSGTIDIIIQEVGKSSAMLGNMGVGDSILDVVGPLGKPTRIENFGIAVCVGGGIGTAPVYPIAKAMREAGNRVVSIIGARNKSLLILEKEMREVSDELHVATDDGSYGHHGFVTQVLQNLIDGGMKMGCVVGIGPVPMMRAVSNVTRPYNIPTVVSLNPIMVDGTGMCGSCRVTVGGKTQFVCVDGPEFDGHQVDYAELILRNRSYLKEEKLAMEELTCHEGVKCYDRK